MYTYIYTKILSKSPGVVAPPTIHIDPPLSQIHGKKENGSKPN